jgi:WhiB family transcriptional regulator, redox-sensing transcriptional regulator
MLNVHTETRPTASPDSALRRAMTTDHRIPCTDEPDLWFSERSAEVELAKTLCGTCPVRSACLAAALDRGEPWGVWGGEVFELGVIVARKRGRGRPPKHDGQPQTSGRRRDLRRHANRSARPEGALRAPV